MDGSLGSDNGSAKFGNSSRTFSTFASSGSALNGGGGEASMAFGDGGSFITSSSTGMNCSMVWSNEVSISNLSAISSHTHGSGSKKSWGEASVKFRAQNFVAQNTIQEESLETFYTIGAMLGEGGFGEVYSCTHIESGEERAVKVITKQDDPIDNDAVIAEFDIVKDLDHPNILKLYALFESDTHFYLVTDLYAGGELYDELERVEVFQEDEVALMMNSILSCINYCHKKNLAHLDLKPENILLEENRNFNDVKVIDFGLAQYGDHFKEARGSVQYMAPQVIQSSYTKKCDIWSCGVIAFLCLAGYAPFDRGEDDLTLDAIEEGQFDFNDPAWDTVSDEALDFIHFLLTYEEEQRPSAEHALQHPWLKNIRAKQLNDHNKCPKRRASTQASLEGLQNFKADSKLKQCVYSLIASQLLKKEEKEEIDGYFRALDLDCDGKISREDFMESYTCFFDLDLCEDEIEEIFEQVNFSGTGAIEYSEFAVATMVENGRVNDAMLEQAFKIFDKEDKGYISVKNLKEVLDLGDDMNNYIIYKIIGQVDKAGHGTINYSDFKDMMLSGPSTSSLVEVAKKSSKKGSSKKKDSARRRRTSRSNSSNSAPKRSSSFAESTYEAAFTIDEEDSDDGSA